MQSLDMKGRFDVEGTLQTKRGVGGLRVTELIGKGCL